MTSAKKLGIFLLVLGTISLVFVSTACKKEAAPVAQKQEVQKPQNMYEGTVKMAVGKYLYLPTAQGMDMVAEGFDATSVLGKEVRVNGEVIPDKPWIFRADVIEVKQGGSYSKVFTRSAEPNISEVMDLNARAAYQGLLITGVKDASEWEGKGKAKAYGRLQGSTILLTAESGAEVGKIVVDNMNNFAKYYMTKLHLFEKAWFYFNVKNSVDAATRTKSKELFHADVVYVALY